jgi:hypothetical protein
VLDVRDPGVLPGSIGLFAIHDRQRPLGIGARWLLAELQRLAWFEGSASQGAHGAGTPDPMGGTSSGA